MDLDDELLGLVEGKRKSKSSGKRSTKRKRPVASDDSASDMDMSSDSDAPPAATKARRGVKSAAEVDASDEEAGGADDEPYPLEGIYRDEADRRHIQSLPELEREDIIATRKDEMTERETRRQVAKMASKQGGAAGAASSEEDEDDEEYGRTTRQRKTTGTSKSKAEGLEKLKRSRAEKGKKKEKHDDSDDDYEEGGRSSRRRRSSAGYSDESEGSGDEDTDKKSKVSKKKDAPQAGPSDFRPVMVTRSKLAELCPAPWFGDWVKGAWVRLGIGKDPQGMPTYRLCQVQDVRSSGKPYRLEGTTTDVELKLRHGSAINWFKMETISDSTFTDREFGRISQVYASEKIDLPTPKELGKIKDQLTKHTTYLLTEQDLAQQLAKKRHRPVGAAAKARLVVQRDHALQSGDTERYKEIVAQLAEMDAVSSTKESEQERMKRVNERNRASNREEIQRAEARNQEERRKQAALLAKGENVKVDPSARVKTMTRLTYDSRTATPTPGTPNGGSTPTGGVSAPPPSIAAAAARTKGSKIEATVASRVQLDVDLDF
ncbi:hypothetical protein JCM5296_001147 [Sporobolomyces johnsonii]